MRVLHSAVQSCTAEKRPGVRTEIEFPKNLKRILGTKYCRNILIIQRNISISAIILRLN